jgi:hypothetical protein
MKKSCFSIFFLVLFGCTKNTNIIMPHSAMQSGNANNIQSTLQFAGRVWDVTNATVGKIGPGPNYFAANNVWVDTSGNLHLMIKRNLANRKWYCAQLSTQQSLGYGTYQFWVEGAIDKLDKNVVLGLFNYSGHDGYDEMDIEMARWGNANNANLNYTVYPDWDDRNSGFTPQSFSQNMLLNGTYSTHRFRRTASFVRYQSLNGFTNANTNAFAAFTVNKPPFSVSKYNMPVFMNLWLFTGKAPSDGKDVEVIIHAFNYMP